MSAAPDMMRNRFYKPILIALAVLMLCGVSQTQRLLNHDREKLGFTKLTPLQNAPPVLAFTTVALGGFRGLIANVLWIRASELQDQEKYFEMVQLADWITKLEPHFVQVWNHVAWNMAYNISVKLKNPNDRWRWVERGIVLLRDQGLQLNPDEALMYQQLAILFQHKIAGNLDDAHLTYKESWASEMQTLFGGNANIPELLDPKTPEAKERVRILREKYKMDPEIMKFVDETYGPLEWRLPQAHAIYWAEMGRRKAGPNGQDTLRRAIYQTMQQACYQGHITEITKGTNRTFVIGPNLELTAKASASYERSMNEEKDPSVRENIIKAHRNLLEPIIYTLYVDGRTAEAQKWFDYAKKLYSNRITAKSLVEFSIEKLGVSLQDADHDKTTAAVKGFIRQCYIELAADNDDKAAVADTQARYIWNYYQTRMYNAAQEKRVGLDPLPELQRIVANELLDPESDYCLAPEYAAMLRTKLKLPPPAATNGPAATPAQPQR